MTAGGGHAEVSRGRMTAATSFTSRCRRFARLALLGIGWLHLGPPYEWLAWWSWSALSVASWVLRDTDVGHRVQISLISIDSPGLGGHRGPGRRRPRRGVATAFEVKQGPDHRAPVQHGDGELHRLGRRGWLPPGRGLRVGLAPARSGHRSSSASGLPAHRRRHRPVPHKRGAVRRRHALCHRRPDACPDRQAAQHDRACLHRLRHHRVPVRRPVDPGRGRPVQRPARPGPALRGAVGLRPVRRRAARPTSGRSVRWWPPWRPRTRRAGPQRPGGAAVRVDGGVARPRAPRDPGGPHRRHAPRPRQAGGALARAAHGARAQRRRAGRSWPSTPCTRLEMLSGIEFVKGSLDGIAHHHERYDGAASRRGWPATASRWPRGSSPSPMPSTRSPRPAPTAAPWPRPTRWRSSAAAAAPSWTPTSSPRWDARSPGIRGR